MAPLTLDDLLQKIVSTDEGERAAARDAAGPTGAPAILPLAQITKSGDLEVARAAQQAIQHIVYHAGRPGAEVDAQAVTAELLKLLDDSQPLILIRDTLWLIWQIAGEEAVDPIAALFDNDELQEDVRMALERLPGDQATAALQAAYATATDNTRKAALAHSLRLRGVTMPAAPDLRRKPSVPTAVQPIGR